MTITFAGAKEGEAQGNIVVALGVHTLDIPANTFVHPAIVPNQEAVEREIQAWWLAPGTPLQEEPQPSLLREKGQTKFTRGNLHGFIQDNPRQGNLHSSLEGPLLCSSPHPQFRCWFCINHLAHLKRMGSWSCHPEAPPDPTKQYKILLSLYISSNMALFLLPKMLCVCDLHTGCLCDFSLPE